VGRRILTLLGSLILAAGLVLAAIGGHKIVTNLPLSEERVVEEARRALFGQQQASENPSDPSSGESVELEIWKSALEMMSEVSKAKRTEGIAFLLSGVIAILWGLTILYNSKSTPDS